MSSTWYPYQNPKPRQWLFRRAVNAENYPQSYNSFLQAVIDRAKTEGFSIPSKFELYRLNWLAERLAPYFGGSGIKTCYILTDSNEEFSLIDWADTTRVANNTTNPLTEYTNKYGWQGSTDTDAQIDTKVSDNDVAENATKDMWATMSFTFDTTSERMRLIGRYSSPRFHGVLTSNSILQIVYHGAFYNFDEGDLTVFNNDIFLMYRSGDTTRTYRNNSLSDEQIGVTLDDGVGLNMTWAIGKVNGSVGITNNDLFKTKFLIRGSDEQIGIKVAGIMREFYDTNFVDTTVRDWSGVRDGAETGRTYYNDGTTSVVEIPSAEGTVDFNSLTFWFKSPQSATKRCFFRSYNGIETDGTYLANNLETLHQSFRLDDNEWHFGCYIYNGTNFDFYVDGTLYATINATFTGVTCIGAFQTGGGTYPFDGGLFDYRFIQEQITLQQADEIMNFRDTNVTYARWYRLDEVAGSKTAIDYSGNAQHGTYFATNRLKFYEGEDVPYSFFNEQGINEITPTISFNVDTSSEQLSENYYRFNATEVSGDWSFMFFRLGNNSLNTYDVRGYVKADSNVAELADLYVDNWTGGTVEKIADGEFFFYGTIYDNAGNTTQIRLRHTNGSGFIEPITGVVYFEILKVHDGLPANQPRVRYDAQFLDVNPSSWYWHLTDNEINNNPQLSPNVPKTPVNDADTWEAGTTYTIGDPVVWDGKEYEALTTTTGDQPDLSPTEWQFIQDAFTLSHIFSITDLINTDSHFFDNIQANELRNLMLYNEDLVDRALLRNKKKVRL